MRLARSHLLRLQGDSRTARFRLGFILPCSRWYSPGHRLSAEEAGITEFRTPDLPGFPASLKQVRHDFQVREISLDGEVLALTKLWDIKDAEACTDIPGIDLIGGPKDPDSSAPPERGNKQLPQRDESFHLRFRMYKEGLDTMQALSKVARCVERSRRSFRFAGTKDRCAATVQLVSCIGLRPETLLRAPLDLRWDPSIRFSDLEVSQDVLALGDLSGNRFEVVLRGLPAGFCHGPGLTEVERSLVALKERGFVNYFGTQRFGTQKIHAFQVGCALLTKNFDKVIALILGQEGGDASPSPSASTNYSENDNVFAAQALFAATGDASRALEMMPRAPSVFLERTLLGALAEGLTASEALERLPRQTLMLYVKATQSLIFNHVASRRLREFGTEPRIGDLVLAPSETSSSVTTRRLADVMEIAEADLQHVQAEDLVLPLPGSGIRYPTYLQKVYEEVSLEVLKLPLSVFHEAPPFGMPLVGDYRRMVVKPMCVEWEVLSPEEAAARARSNKGRLLKTDAQRLLEAQAGVNLTHNAESPQNQEKAFHPKNASIPSTGTGSIILKCDLPSSSYLTVAVREVTRKDDGWQGVNKL